MRREFAAVQIETDQGPVRVTVTIGVTTYLPEEHGTVTASSLLEVADKAMREGKLAGRDRVRFLPFGTGTASPVEAGDGPAPVPGDDRSDGTR